MESRIHNSVLLQITHEVCSTAKLGIAPVDKATYIAELYMCPVLQF